MTDLPRVLSHRSRLTEQTLAQSVAAIVAFLHQMEERGLSDAAYRAISERLADAGTSAESLEAAASAVYAEVSPLGADGTPAPRNNGIQWIYLTLLPYFDAGSAVTEEQLAEEAATAEAAAAAEPYTPILRQVHIRETGETLVKLRGTRGWTSLEVYERSGC